MYFVFDILFFWEVIGLGFDYDCFYDRMFVWFKRIMCFLSLLVVWDYDILVDIYVGGGIRFKFFLSEVLYNIWWWVRLGFIVRGVLFWWLLDIGVFDVCCFVIWFV